MRFLAIDPGSRNMGCCLFEDDKLVHWECLQLVKVEYASRYQHIDQRLTRIYQLDGFQEIACEQAVKFQGRQIPELEVAVRAIRKWAKSHKVPISFYNVATWKAAVVENPHASKDEVARIICLQYPTLSEASEHVTDAAGIGVYHWGIRRLEAMAII